jgi:hypothetical protein
MAKHSERLVLLESTPTEMEAGIIVAALEEAGIQATMTGAHTAGFRAEAPGWVKILVAEGDLLQARTIFRDVVRENKDVDWSQVDVGEATSDESDSVPTHWLASLVFWRRIASVLIVLFLIWIVVGIVGDVFAILFRLTQRASSAN